MTSWVFMKGNLSRIVQCLTGYYRHHLGLLLPTRRMADLTQLARLGEVEEVDTLIRQILGVAVTCSHRATHINIILSLNIEVRVVRHDPRQSTYLYCRAFRGSNLADVVVTGIKLDN